MNAQPKRTFTPEDQRKADKLKAAWEANKGRLDLNQHKIAKKLGISQSMFSQMIQGHAAIPKILLLKATKILEVDPEKIDPSLKSALQIDKEIELKTYIFPVMFSLPRGKPKESTVKVHAQDSTGIHGYAVQIVNTDYTPFIKVGGYAVVNPLARITKEDLVFIRLIEGEDLIAIYDRFENGTHFVKAMTANSPFNPNGYDDANVVSIHYINGFQQPK